MANKPEKKPAIKPKKKALPIKINMNDSTLFDARFYQTHYIRGLKLILGLLLLNILLLLGAYYFLKQHVPADVYAVTLTGKLVKLDEIPASSGK